MTVKKKLLCDDLISMVHYKYTLYSCNMSTSGLPDIYTQSTRAAGPRAEGVYTISGKPRVSMLQQTTSAHVTTIMYQLFIRQKPMQTPNNSNKQ